MLSSELLDGRRFALARGSMWCPEPDQQRLLGREEVGQLRPGLSAHVPDGHGGEEPFRSRVRHRQFGADVGIGTCRPWTRCTTAVGATTARRCDQCCGEGEPGHLQDCTSSRHGGRTRWRRRPIPEGGHSPNVSVVRRGMNERARRKRSVEPGGVWPTIHTSSGCTQAITG